MDKTCPTVVPQIATCSELVSVICLSLLVNTQSAVWVMCIAAVCVHGVFSWLCWESGDGGGGGDEDC